MYTCAQINTQVLNNGFVGTITIQNYLSQHRLVLEINMYTVYKLTHKFLIVSIPYQKMITYKYVQ